MAADAKGTDLKSAYRRIMDDHFPDRMEISFIGPDGTQTLAYEKATWVIGGEEKGLRYGENPGQEAALYRLAAGSLVLGNTTTIRPGRWLASNAELLQSGKHPGKINITDVDSALGILRHLCGLAVRGDREAQQSLRRGESGDARRGVPIAPTWPTGSRPSAAPSP